MAGPIYRLPNGDVYWSTQALLESLAKAGADPAILGQLGARFMRQAVENMQMKQAMREAGFTHTTSPPKEG